MDRKVLAARRFGTSDQVAFAALSGDHNPVHLDAAAARRTQAGAPVVHGMHALLWALDALASSEIVGPQLGQIGAQFRKFTYLNVPCEVILVQRAAGAAKAELRSNGVILTTVQLRDGPRLAEAAAAADLALPNIAIASDRPHSPALSELAGSLGWTSVPGTAAEFERAFPRLCNAVGAERVAALAALSRVVGMYCPGLHSIFAGFAVDLVESQSGRTGIGFRVTSVNDRFRMMGADVRGSGIAGKVTAFMRWPPVEAPSMAAVAETVAAAEFAGTVALIVGGSRGLGAVTAKAIAAGGGRVVVTYLQGRDEAGRLAAEITAVHGPDACTALAYDSSGNAAAQLSALTEEVNQLYYFATPQIFRQSSDVFSPHTFRDFCSVYLDGFYDVCRYVRARSRAPSLAVFYPSSVAVEERPAGLAEYAMAKAAGEVLCGEMMLRVAGLKVIVARLPRVLTDQTATITQFKSADPLTVMLPLIRELQMSA